MRNMLLCSILSLVSLFYSCSVEDLEYCDNIDKLSANSFIINDYLNQTCASAVELAYDSNKDIVYAVYLSSNSEYGESRDMFIYC